VKITITAEGYYGKVTGEFDLTNYDENTRSLADSCIKDVLNAAGIENDVVNDEDEESEVES
jgi:uncharacterized lipoprotein YajG